MTRNGGRSSATVVLVAVMGALVLPASAGAAHAPFRFAGRTSQRLPVRLQIPWSFVGVRNFNIAWDARCTSGAMYTSGSSSRGTLRFNRAGPGWNHPGSYRQTAVDPDYTASNGRTLSFRVVVGNAGKTLLNARVRGTWRARITVTDPTTGQVIDTCTTGRVTWTADLL